MTSAFKFQKQQKFHVKGSIPPSQKPANLLLNQVSGTLESKNLKLSISVLNEHFLLNFYNKVSAVHDQITFTMRYYESYQGSGQDSGAYIFKPKAPMSHMYGSQKQVTGVYSGKLVQQFSLKSWDMENQNSFAKVRLADSHLDFEVLLDSIPGNSWEGQGKEVIASWKSS